MMKKSVMRVYFGSFVQAQWVRIQAERICLSNILEEKNVEIDEKIIQFKKSELHYDEKYLKDGVEVQVLNWSNIVSLLSISRKEILNRNPDIIHCHSWIATLIVCISMFFLKNKPLVVYEVHGATAFESWYRNNKSLMRFFSFPIFYFLENLAGSLADKLFLVSYEIKKYYPTYYLKPSFVISRKLSNSKNNLDNNIVIKNSFLKFIEDAKSNNMPVIVYSGGFSKWQLPKETVSFMNLLISKNLAKGVIFTNEIDKFKKHTVESKNWYFDSLNSNELLSYLKLCDVGILLREDIVLNRVASPTKLYEYIHADLVVLTTKGAKEAKFACSKYNYYEINLDDLFANKIEIDNIFYELLSVLKLNKNISKSNENNEEDSCHIFCAMYDIK